MVDRPGRPKEFRFRELQHTTADVLVEESRDARGRDADRGSRDRCRGTGIRPVRPGGSRVCARILSRLSREVDSASPRLPGAAHSLPRRRREDQSHPDGRLRRSSWRSWRRSLRHWMWFSRISGPSSSYEIKHVDAEEVRKHLAEFDLIDNKTPRLEMSAGDRRQSVDSVPHSGGTRGPERRQGRQGRTLRRAEAPGRPC